MKKATYILSLVLITVILFSNNIQAQERKKWSPQAKGTVIGAGTGAAAGAIINKRNRAVGGVVGGVVGGAAGYAIGKRKDNKNKEAAAVAAANRAAANRAAANRAAANRVASTKKSSSSGNHAVAATGAMAYTANTQALQAGYLPNNAYGNPNMAYGNYDYRRKSW